MRSYLWVICLLPACTGAFGQRPDSMALSRQIDSLILLNQGAIRSDSFARALQLISDAESLTGKELGRHSAVYANCLFNHGRTFDYMRQYPEAERYYLASKAIWENDLGANGKGYCRTLNNLASLCFSMRRYDEAEVYYQQTASVAKRVLGDHDSFYGLFLNNHADFYKTLGLYEKAEPLLIEAEEVFANAEGRKDPDYYAWSLVELGNLYQTKGAYRAAEEQYLEAQAIWAEVLGKSHAYYGASLNSLASIYEKTGDYARIEPLLREALGIEQKREPINRKEYATDLNDLAVYYHHVGNFPEAESHFRQAADMIAQSEGGASAAYATYVSNLGYLYLKWGRYEQAEIQFKAALAIQKALFGEDHPDYAASLFGLGEVCLDTGRPDVAQPLLQQALRIQEKALGKTHPDYGQTLNSLAALYVQKGQADTAIALLQEAVAIQANALGRLHPNYAYALSALGRTYASAGNDRAAEPLLIEAEQLNRRYVANGLYFLTENEMDQYAANSRQETDQFYGYLRKHPAAEPDMLRLAWDDALFFKGILLEKNRSLEHYLAAAPDSVQRIGDQWKGYQRRLADEYAKPLAERDSLIIQSLEGSSARLEQTLVRAGAGFADARRTSAWAEVKNALQKKEAAVEFVRFQGADAEGRPTDSLFYAALVLRPQDSVPHWVNLFEERQLQALLSSAGQRAESIESLYATRSGDLIEDRPAYGPALYRLVWAPLAPLLGRANTVYFAPAGLLHRISFAALPCNKNQLLAARYRLRQLGSTRNIALRKQSVDPSGLNAAVFGAVVYESPEREEAPDSTLAPVWSWLAATRAQTDNGFAFLPGTQREADRVSDRLTAHHIPVRQWTGREATEEQFKALGPGPGILHIATHGFAFPEPNAAAPRTDNVFQWQSNPLFRSGLALAGANAVWTGGYPPRGREDGICTAYEISQLDLSQTQLVVLSACETGLGDIRGSEGVYGLQRAFKMAGAGRLIVSLWQVPDEKTVRFMDLFYRYWLRGRSIDAAFDKAQRAMRRRSGVYAWGAWVLVE